MNKMLQKSVLKMEDHSTPSYLDKSPFGCKGPYWHDIRHAYIKFDYTWDLTTYIQYNDYLL